MSSFTSPDLRERRNNAATVKKVMLEKFRVARQDPLSNSNALKGSPSMRRELSAASNAKPQRRCVRRNWPRKRRAPPNSPRRRTARPRKPRRSLRLKRPNAMRRWPRSKKPSAMPGTQHARPQKRSGGAGTSGFRSITAIQDPRWVISGHFAVQSTCPLYPQ